MEPVSGLGGAVIAQIAEAGTARVSVEDTEAARFAAMIVPAEAPAVPEAAGIGGGVAPAALRGVSTPGDAILDGMRAIGAEFNSTWEAMKVAVDQSTKTMSVADMLRVQMQMIQLSVQVELVGKAIGRTTQNIDQLVKLQ